MNFGTDLKLSSINVEISAIKDGYELIRSTIDDRVLNEKHQLEYILREDNSLSEIDLEDAYRQLYENVEVFYPRLFWGPFLITLFSVFESYAGEITELIGESKGSKLRLKDLNGSLLKKLKKYYLLVLDLNYFEDNPYWQSLTDLYKVRNIFAHSNGRCPSYKAN